MKPFHVQGLPQLWQEEPDVYRTKEFSLLMGLNKQSWPVSHCLTHIGDTPNDPPPPKHFPLHTYPYHLYFSGPLITFPFYLSFIRCNVSAVCLSLFRQIFLDPSPLCTVGFGAVLDCNCGSVKLHKMRLRRDMSEICLFHVVVGEGAVRDSAESRLDCVAML